MNEDRNINIEIFIGAAPLLALRVVEGLIEFGEKHPNWRFSIRGNDFRYNKEKLKEIDGAIVLINETKVKNIFNKASLPWVHLLPGKKVSHYFIDIEDEEIGKMGAKFFLERGFMKCAFCGVGTPWSKKRFKGFREILSKHGRKCSFYSIPFESVEYWNFPYDIEKKIVEFLKDLSSGTALMVAHDVLAERVVDICIRNNIKIPKDIAVLGVGNYDLFCKLTPIRISSIETGVSRIASIAAELLNKLIHGYSDATSLIVPPVRVFERESTEIIEFGDDIVKKAVSYIRKYISDRITVEQLNRYLNVSGKTLYRRFMKYVGHSPIKEIQNARLHYACKLLYDSNMSLSEIAYTSGYSDLAHMNRCFVKKLKKTPGEMRKSL